MDNQEPIEVTLVDEVKSCTDCQWFWGAIPPYGPFPSFDFKEAYPAAIKDGPDKQSNHNVQAKLWTQASHCGSKQVEPAVLRGCRKAPIMTIGINPNMTGYFASATSSTWVYPYFKRPETYAYYYRHATIYQESLSADYLARCLINGSEIYAQDDGVLSITRSQSHRWACFTLEPDNAQSTPITQEIAWIPEERLVMFTPTRNQLIHPDLSQSELMSELKGIRVKKGDLIAGKLNSDTQHDDVDIYANKVGYYERLLPVLEQFSYYFKQQGFNKLQLEIGEDVCLHDMVACASPGWNDRYDIPMEHIAKNCVLENAYLFKQLWQSQPRILMIVSDSSLTMFLQALTKLNGTLDLDTADKDIFTLMYETCKQRYFVRWPTRDVSPSRVIITPHFSYGDNFKEQSRFTEEEWGHFTQLYPEDIHLLKDEKRVSNRKGIFSVFVDEDDPLKPDINNAAWNILMDHHYQPNQLITAALIGEHEIDALIDKKQATHLKRSTGGCQFCVNKQWQFPEGCDYGLS